MKIIEIAFKLNELSSGYKIGDLQKIRKKIKNLKTKPGNSIFRNDSISEEGWAFHYGGRKEIQFNIGFEDEGLRFGLAFSLEPSQSLPDIRVLFPKIYKLNCLIREEPERFTSYQMWHWQKGNRSEIDGVREIRSELVNSHTFIFFGKIVMESEINYEEILKTFDDLLEIYLEVEGTANKTDTQIEEVTLSHFEFSRRDRRLTPKRKLNSIERAINVDVRHTLLQEKLIEELIVEYGAENVSYENPLNGKKIDIVVRDMDEYIFLEVKAGSSAKTCIREAIGQLLEYAFWGGKIYAKRMVIASEHELSTEGNRYLDFLKNKFHMPIEYRRIKLES